jgi:hypothetical protein
MCGEEHGGSGRGRTGPRPTAGLHPRQPGDDEPEGGVGSAARAPRTLLLPVPVRPQHQVQRRPAARAVVRVLPALDDPHHVRRRHGRHRLRLWVRRRRTRPAGRGRLVPPRRRVLRYCSSDLVVLPLAGTRGRRAGPATELAHFRSYLEPERQRRLQDVPVPRADADPWSVQQGDRADVDQRAQRPLQRLLVGPARDHGRAPQAALPDHPSSGDRRRRRGR